jgi:hypothetical protein
MHILGFETITDSKSKKLEVDIKPTPSLTRLNHLLEI